MFDILGIQLAPTHPAPTYGGLPCRHGLEHLEVHYIAVLRAAAQLLQRLLLLARGSRLGSRIFDAMIS